MGGEQALSEMSICDIMKKGDVVVSGRESVRGKDTIKLWVFIAYNIRSKNRPRQTLQWSPTEETRYSVIILWWEDSVTVGTGRVGVHFLYVVVSLLLSCWESAGHVL